MGQLVEMQMSVAQTRETFFAELYEQAYPVVARFVAQKGGSFEDAKDVFHDSMVILFELVTEKKIEITQSYQAYLVGIAKHIWIRKFKAARHTVSMDSLEASITIPADYFEPADNKLLVLLERSGKKCMELLRAFYYDKTPLESIAALFGFSGVRSATAQKFKCIDKMRTIVKQNAMNYEDFSE